MCAMWERRKDEISPVLKFYIRRGFRIAGPFWLAIAFYLWLGGFHRDTYEVGTSQIVSTLLFVHPLWPTWINSIVPGGWSIGVEVMFYMFFPLLARLNKPAVFYLIFGFVVYVVNTIVIDPLWLAVIPAGVEISDFLSRQFFSQAPIFLIGIYLFKIQRNSSGAIMPTVAISAGWIASAFILKMKFGYHAEPMFWVALLLVTSGCFVILLRQIAFFPINKIGQVSYSMYLSHFAVLHFFHDRSWSFGFGFLVVVSVSYTISVVLRHAIEIPSSNVGRWLINAISNAKQAILPAQGAG